MAKTDEILHHTGDFGRFQIRILLLLSLTGLFTGPFNLMAIFIMDTPEHRCKLENYTGDTFEIQNANHQNLIDMYIPVSKDVSKKYDQCHIYSFDQLDSVVYNGTRHINSTKTKCQSWVYSKENFRSTFVTETNLVCDNKYKSSLAKTIFFAGHLVGSFVFGFLADIIGRHKTLMLASGLLFVFSMALAWSTSYVMYALLRFGVGMCNIAFLITAYVLTIEWVGPPKRRLASVLHGMISITAMFYQALMAYLLREWKYIEISISALVALTVLNFWFLPESPRWLVSRGRVDEARILLEKAAKVNKKEIPARLLESLVAEEKQERGKLWLLFTNRTLAVRTLIIFFNWLVVSMVFYGLSLNIGNLYGNLFINFLISTVVEYLAEFLFFVMIDRVGRKKSHCCYMCVGGIACLATIFTVRYGGASLGWLTTTLAMIGKCFATASFISVYLYSSELYPTVVRNAGMGASSCSARIGGMISPAIADLANIVGGKVGKAVPLIIFGSASLVAGLAALYLPETFGRKLPETTEDSKHFTRWKQGTGVTEIDLQNQPSAEAK